MTCATVQRQFLTEENPVKITVMTNNDFEAIGCMRPIGFGKTDLSLYVSKTELHNAANIS